jgi:hypothetical protein
MIFTPFKLMENNLKGVKMTQNRSKPWAIVHGFDRFWVIFTPF